MSTKIYNGYRLPSGAQPIDLTEIARKLNRDIEPVYRELAIGVIATIQQIYENQLNDKNGDHYQALWETLFWVTEDQVKPEELRIDHRLGTFILATDIARVLNLKLSNLTTNVRCPDYDLSCSATFLNDQAWPGTTLALLYEENKRYREQFLITTNAEPYPYWDNSDRPDELTDHQWDERKDTWDRALPYGTMPVQNGLTWNFVPHDDLLIAAGAGYRSEKNAWLTPELVNERITAQPG